MIHPTRSDEPHHQLLQANNCFLVKSPRISDNNLKFYLSKNGEFL